MADDHRPGDLYERDFYLWTQLQAEAIRAEGARSGSNAVDWAHVAEEIEDMGGRDLRECYSRITTILEHLYKLAWSHRPEPRAGWRTAIRTQRRELDFVVTGSLRAKLHGKLEELHLKAMGFAREAFDEEEPDAPRDASLRWTLEQVLGEENDPLG